MWRHFLVQWRVFGPKGSLQQWSYYHFRSILKVSRVHMRQSAGDGGWREGKSEERVKGGMEREWERGVLRKRGKGGRERGRRRWEEKRERKGTEGKGYSPNLPVLPHFWPSDVALTQQVEERSHYHFWAITKVSRPHLQLFLVMLLINKRTRPKIIDSCRLSPGRGNCVAQSCRCFDKKSVGASQRAKADAINGHSFSSGQFLILSTSSPTSSTPSLAKSRRYHAPLTVSRQSAAAWVGWSK